MSIKIYRGETPTFEFLIQEQNVNTNETSFLDLTKAKVRLLLKKNTSKTTDLDVLMSTFYPTIDNVLSEVLCGVRYYMSAQESYNLSGEYLAQLEIRFNKEDTGIGRDVVYIKDLESYTFDDALKSYTNLKNTILKV